MRWCDYNKAILCTRSEYIPIEWKPSCNKCGWNPEVMRKRMATSKKDFLRRIKAD